LRKLYKVLLLRTISTGITVFVLLNAVFFFTIILPGDPALVLVPEGASESVLQEIRSNLGLDLPVHVQYYNFMWRAFSGNLGRSWYLSRGVYRLVMEALPTTVELATLGILFAIASGIIGGALASKNEGKYPDYLFRFLTLAFFAAPIFVTGPILQYLCGVRLGFLPTSGRIDARTIYTPMTGFIFIDGLLTVNTRLVTDWLLHMLLPALILGLYLSAIIGRLTRREMLRVRKEDFVLTAHAKGLKENTVLFRHVLRNALIPIVTALGFQFASLLGGAVIIESIFNLPGLGSLLIKALHTRDFPLIQGTLVFAVLFVGIMSVILDFAYTLLDPRVKL
jgi:peptide/nickel transport system permease protein